MPRSTVLTSLAFAAALTAMACGDDDPVLPTDPSTPVLITQAFDDSLNPNGGRTHQFNADRAGDVIASLTSLAPDPEVVIGLGIGTWNGVSCSITIANDNARLNVAIIGSATGTGAFCVRVYDVGNLTGSIDYTVTVQHY
jgi:hypothetical protein